MARTKEHAYYLRSKKGRAVLEYTTPEGQRFKSLGLAYDPERSTPREREAARRACAEAYRELTEGRVVDADKRVRTVLTFSELYHLYLERWGPVPGETENARRKREETRVVRRSYGTNVLEWASDEATRPDGTKRWRGDRRTPLQRLTAEDGPGDYLAFRLLRVVRTTMRKEKSNLVAFFDWAKANGFLSSVPAIKLPAGKGTIAIDSGRGKHVPLTPAEARALVLALPEWSTRASRLDGAKFRVRAFFEFMRLTGLRPATIERLEAGRNWSHGDVHLVLDNEDDKIAYGRTIRLPTLAAQLLEEIVPRGHAGHIFGHRARAAFIRKAAEKVLDARRAALFGAYHFRHFVGSFLAARTTDLPSVGFLLGHKQVSTTAVYVHSNRDAADALVEATDAEQKRIERAARKALRSKERHT